MFSLSLQEIPKSCLPQYHAIFRTGSFGCEVIAGKLRFRTLDLYYRQPSLHLSNLGKLLILNVTTLRRIHKICTNIMCVNTVCGSRWLWAQAAQHYLRMHEKVYNLA